MPAETRSPPAGVGSSLEAPGSTSGPALFRVRCPVSFPVSCFLSASLQTKLASACRLASFWDPCKKGVCLACRLPGTVRSARVSRAIGAADPQNFSAHGPSTKLGSFGLPSAFLRRLRNRFGTHLRFFVALLLVSSRLCLHRVFPLLNVMIDFLYVRHYPPSMSFFLLGDLYLCCWCG
ncbi:hypothetical protein C8R43DRAFT_167143 [Mycena crocata]|nr:hypothetical protein C8R43DRAFT_167143 [Mycena crocata]